MKIINWKRVLIGGLAAGVVSIALMIVVISPLMMPSWEFGMKSGMWAAPSPQRYILNNLALILTGILATFLYAAIRSRFGASVKTAILTGLFVALFKDVLPGIERLIWSNEPGESVKLWVVLSSVSSVVSTFVGAWIYKE